jgi:hypothetical protein
MKCSFLLNARPLTLDSEFYAASRCGGYLFPPEQAQAAVVGELVRRYRQFVVADNGAFDDIGRIAATVRPAGDRDHWERARDQLRKLSAAVDTQSKLNLQLSVRPDAVVGAEDITLAVWLRAGLPEELLRKERVSLARRNSVSAQQGLALANSLGGVTVLTVASAHDYDTAFDAGQQFSAAGIRHAAMGFGAFMADDDWTSTIKVRGHLRKLPHNLPNRYLRTALVVKGFFDGWSTRDSAPEHFHFLGLGAPIMLPIAALAAQKTKLVTFDATSPIKDATSGSLYVTLPAPLTVRLWKVAERMTSEQRNWTCPCRFCRAFLSSHPLNLDEAKAIRDASGPFTSDDLGPGEALGEALPLFRIASDVIGKQAERTRVLSTLARNLSARTRDLDQFVAKRVALYQAHAGRARFAEAVGLALKIVKPESEFWS